MATDPKLTSSILDLSRNVDKLTTELRKNPPASRAEDKKSEAADSLGEIAETFKGMKLSDLPKQFEELRKGLKQINFSDFTKQLTQLDFKGLSQTIKSFKPAQAAEEGVKKLASQTFKDLKSSILGGFEKGGTVPKSGNYVVGEKGPEVVKLKAGDKVVPNKSSKTDELLQMIIDEKRESAATGKKTPSKEEIEQERLRLLRENPDYVTNPDELQDDLDYFIRSYGRETFSREDLAKLTKPVTPAQVTPAPPPPPTETPAAEESRKERRRREREEKRASRGSAKEGEPGAEGEAGVKTTPSKLGKLISGLVRPGEVGAETFSEEGATNIESGLGLASSKASLLKSGSLFKSTLQKNLPKVPAPPKLLKEIGGLTKGTPATQGEETQKSLGGLIQKMQETLQQKPPSAPEVEEASSKVTPVEKTEGAEGGQGLTKDDVNEMKSALLRIASLLEGPISVTPLDYPFRPDSRRV